MQVMNKSEIENVRGGHPVLILALGGVAAFFGMLFGIPALKKLS